MRIYIAGPMTGYERYNVEAFLSAAERWRGAGWEVVTPFDTNSIVWERHYGRAFRPGEDKCDYGDPLVREMISADMGALCSADAIALLPGWEASKGATTEARVALLLGLRFFRADSMGPMETPALALACTDDEVSVITRVAVNMERALGRYVSDEEAGAEPSTPADLDKGGVKYDTDKPRWYLLPLKALEGAVRVLMYGAKKYRAWNWRKGMRWTRVYDAAMRHLIAWAECEDNDPDTGLNHIDHALCELIFLREFIRTGTGEDDRYRTDYAIGVDFAARDTDHTVCALISSTVH